MDTVDRIEVALRAIASGSLVVVVDDEDRENEGDLIMAAEKATPESIAFMVRWTSGARFSAAGRAGRCAPTARPR